MDVERLIDLQRFVPPTRSLSHHFLSDVFPDSFGVLEGEKLVRSTSTQYKFRYCEQLVVYHDPESHSRLNHRSLRSIVTTPLVNPSSDGEFEDWTALSRPASHSIEIHISGLRGYPGSTSSLVCFPASCFTDTAHKPLPRT